MPDKKYTTDGGVRKREFRRGDVYFARLDGMGSEQYGRRPVLIIQNDVGNRYSPTTIVAILTTKKKTNMPTHIVLEDFEGLPQVSVVCLEQIRTIDKMRLEDYRGNIGKKHMKQVEQGILISVGMAQKRPDTNVTPDERAKEKMPAGQAGAVPPAPEKPEKEITGENKVTENSTAWRKKIVFQAIAFFIAAVLAILVGIVLFRIF